MSNVNDDFAGLAVFFMVLFVVALGIAVGGISHTDTFYVAPERGNYSVYVHGSGLCADTRISKPLPLKEASELADRLNADTAGKWSWSD